MKKFIIAIVCMVASISHLQAMSCDDERQTVTDRVKANLVAYEAIIKDYSIQSGLDVQQYYYLLGMRDAYRQTLIFMDLDAIRQLYLDSADPGERSTSTSN